MLERLGEAARELRVGHCILEVPSHAPSSVPADTLRLRCLLALHRFARPFSGLALRGHRLHRTRQRPCIGAVTIDGMPDGEAVDAWVRRNEAARTEDRRRDVE